MSRYFWVICCDCQEEWIAPFVSDYGCLFAEDQHGEECTDCGSSDIEVQDEWKGEDSDDHDD